MLFLKTFFTTEDIYLTVHLLPPGKVYCQEYCVTSWFLQKHQFFFIKLTKLPLSHIHTLTSTHQEAQDSSPLHLHLYNVDLALHSKSYQNSLWMLRSPALYLLGEKRNPNICNLIKFKLVNTTSYSKLYLKILAVLLGLSIKFNQLLWKCGFFIWGMYKWLEQLHS